MHALDTSYALERSASYPANIVKPVGTTGATPPCRPTRPFGSAAWGRQQCDRGN